MLNHRYIDRMIETNDDTFDDLFLHAEERGQDAYLETVKATMDLISVSIRRMEDAYSGKNPQGMKAMIGGMSIGEKEGEPIEEVLADVEKMLLNSINVNHKTCIAHLHCPPLIPALAAEMVISATNQSMDSWDQSSAATYLEEELIGWFCNRLKLSEKADGTFTSGGTQSNYMGLLLARDAYCDKRWNWNVQKNGLPPEAHRLRILCSKEAHFTVKKSASQLGLGEEAVIQVDTDENHRLSLDDLHTKLNNLKSENLLPFALVATCGTTDFGSIDPLQEMAVVAREHGMWLHADAAYGGALMLSRRESHRLKSIAEADSITADFHKLFYQPISCGAFFIQDKENFKYLNYHADYLNPEEDEEQGFLHLVNKSVQTTRRFDALKLFMSLRVTGLDRFGDMIDCTFKLARYTAGKLKSLEDFELVNSDPELNALVFRYQPAEAEDVCGLNKRIQQELLHSGRAVIAKTQHQGESYLKFTLLNPRTSKEDIDELLNDIRVLGEQLSRNGGRKT